MLNEVHGRQTESWFLRFASGRLTNITAHLIGVANRVNCIGVLRLTVERTVLDSRSY